MAIWDRIGEDPMRGMLLLSALQQLPQSLSKQNLPPRGAYVPGGYGGQQDGGMGDMVPMMLRMQQMRAAQENQMADNALQQRQFEAQQAAAQRQQENIAKAAQVLGVDPAVLALNMGEFGKSVAERFGTNKLAPGERLMFGDQVAAHAPALLEVTPGGFANREAGIYERNAQMQADAMARGQAGATRVSVSPTAIYGATQGAFDKKIYDAAGDSYVGMQKEAEAARKMADDFGRIDALLGETPTGEGFDQWRLRFAKAARGIGIPVDEASIATKEAAESLVNQFALGARSPDGPLGGLPGAASDKDVEFLRSIPPGIEQTPAGRKLMVEAQMAKAEHATRRAQAARQYIQGRNGEIDPVELDAFKAAYDKEHPVFSGIADRWQGKIQGGAAMPPPDGSDADALAEFYLKKGR